ncbi:uncharacterized protein LOC128883813 [Hylaeus volcanicus]|uniref:uncharacterized protein LOC128883813 n=1 Tax=Hylaeus volcanicus TaxID=313075 RepID=UPI0023B83C01|nr:uncharacterized protein LOC128883813 [Hylaeus volcanicus]
MHSNSNYLLVLFSKGISENVVSFFLKDLERYNVRNVEEYKDTALLFSRISNATSKVICVCAAQTCYTLMKDAVTQLSSPKNLHGLILFCGPYEEFYATWATKCPALKFLSHNLKEVRRAVVWCLSGGDFNSQGDAILLDDSNEALGVNEYQNQEYGSKSTLSINNTEIDQLSCRTIQTTQSFTRLIVLWFLHDIIGSRHVDIPLYTS